jgi:carbonic anhydrase
MIIRLMGGLLKELPDEISAIYAQLSKGQHPGVFLLTCADSRVMPELITQSKPGDMFTVRNVGNMMPEYRTDYEQSESSLPPPSEMAALEFAIKALDVKNIIVCGHSDCGAMKTRIHPYSELCITNHWVFSQTCSLPDEEENLEGTQVVGSLSLEHDAEDSKLTHITKLNILTQIEHLKTYPIIQEKLQKGDITLHAWYFDFELKKVFIYESDCRRFMDLKGAINHAVDERRYKIVSTIAKNYIENLEPPLNAEAYVQRKLLIEQLRSNFLSIEEKICSEVTQAFWQEFEGLFTDANDPNLSKMVKESNEFHFTPSEAKELYRKLESSKGYYRYCHPARKRTNTEAEMSVIQLVNAPKRIKTNENLPDTTALKASL